MEVPESIQPNELRFIILNATKPACQDRPSLKVLRKFLQIALRSIPEAELRMAELELPSLQLFLDSAAVKRSELRTCTSMTSTSSLGSLNSHAGPDISREHNNTSLAEISSMIVNHEEDAVHTTNCGGSVPGSLGALGLSPVSSPNSDDDVEHRTLRDTFDLTYTVGSHLDPPGPEASLMDKADFLHQQLDSFGTNMPIHNSLVLVDHCYRTHGGALLLADWSCNACIGVSVGSVSVPFIRTNRMYLQVRQ